MGIILTRERKKEERKIEMNRRIEG